MLALQFYAGTPSGDPEKHKKGGDLVAPLSLPDLPETQAPETKRPGMPGRS